MSNIEFPGSVEHKGAIGLACVFISDCITVSNLVLDSEAIANATLRNNASVYLSGEVAGKCFGLRASENNQKLYVYYTLDDHTKNADSEVYVATPLIEANEINCALCGRWYTNRDQPCPCIYLGPIIKLRMVTITGLHLINGKKEDVKNQDMKEEILSNYFGGSLNGMEFD